MHVCNNEEMAFNYTEVLVEEIGGLAIFCKSLEQCILPTLRVLLCIKTLVGHVMCLKRPITAPFERSEPFHLLRLMGVSVPSLHIESTDSMI